MATTTCNCYVNALPKEEQFSIRRGAHTRCCPVYRESLDPVDRINDQEIREHHLGQLREAMADRRPGLDSVLPLPNAAPGPDPYHPFQGDREAWASDRASRLA